MINFRVVDPDAPLAQLRREGVEVDERTEKSEFGYFGWAMDPEGNRIELWQPPENSTCFAVECAWWDEGMGGEGFEPPTYWV